ncbi:MAG: FecR domain-containing protein [Bacteroidota bacterium]
MKRIPINRDEFYLIPLRNLYFNKMNFFNETIKRFFSKTHSEKDLKNLFLWFNSTKGHSEIKESLDKSWDTFQFDNNIKVDSEKILQNIKKGIRNYQSSRFKRKVRQFLPYVAMLAITISFVFYIYNYRKNYTGQVNINNNYTSIITENGQRSKVVLPDSSIVWLNSGTTLSYHDNFSQNKREVTLNGQAFFEVAHNKERPFTVQCNDLVVSVLGTKFDVEAYPEIGKISVVLKSGKVGLTHQKIASFSYTMSPGEMAEFNLSDNKMNISYPDVEKYSAWKDGILIFKNEPMKEVIDKLRRWYNVDIVVKDQEVYNSVFTGTIQNESYEQIFRLIEFACPIKCQVIYNTEGDVPSQIIISIKKQ